MLLRFYNLNIVMNSHHRPPLLSKKTKTFLGFDKNFDRKTKSTKSFSEGWGDGDSENVPMILEMLRSIFKAKRTKSLNNFAKRAKDSRCTS